MDKINKLPKLIAFDLDGTLSDSKQNITEEMFHSLEALSNITKVAVISGGSFEQVKKQLLFDKNRVIENIILLPAEGSQRYQYDSHKNEWILKYKEGFSKKIRDKVVKLLEEIVVDERFEIPEEHYGLYIEDRGTEISLSALGQDAPLEKKEVWDSDNKKRLKIKAYLEENIPEIEAFIAGTTSVDVLQKGFDKLKSLSLLLKSIKIKSIDMIFVGDAIFPGGNDYSVAEGGIESIRVEGPEDTLEIINKFTDNPIAFFCSEYAIVDDPSMYAGGLGILAGDYVFEMADKNVPFVAFGLKYGTFIPDDFTFLKKDNEDIIVHIPIADEIVKAKVWHRAFSTNTHIFLLDTNIEDNTTENREITSILYNTKYGMFLKQQFLLGIGSIRLINILNINPRIYHLNEGHTAFTALGIMAEKKEGINKIVATKHTILPEAGILINPIDFKNIIQPYCRLFNLDSNDIFKRGEYDLRPELFSTTKFLITSAVKKSGVSRLHTVYERKKHPNSTLIPITNGVYSKRWQAPNLYGRVNILSDEELWKVKRELRKSLFDYINNRYGKYLNPDICTLVWARRFAIYKRPYLLFSDIEKLIDIVSSQDMPLQIIVSGKAHPGDKEGEDTVHKIMNFSEDKIFRGRIVYVPDYSVPVSRELVHGADIWLNTPELGKEACGTSGMKAGLNGALQCSIMDGWVDEVSWDGIGWPLSEENTSDTLYRLLENEILPCFYNRNNDGSNEETPHDWIDRMKKTINIIEKSYTTEQMLERYMDNLYNL